MRNVAAVFFDWGGTLCSVDQQAATFARCAAGACRAARMLGIRLPDGAADRLNTLFWRAHHRPEPADEHPEIRIEPLLASWLSAEGAVTADRLTLTKIGRAFWHPWVGCLRLMGPADAVLGQLRHRGYRLGLVSNVASPPDICCRELERLGLRKSLDVLAFSSQVGHRKPHPAIYHCAIDQLNRDGRQVTAQQILFVGDSPEHDVDVPARMGMKTALLPDHAHHWDPARHAQAKADLRIETAADLLEILSGR